LDGSQEVDYEYDKPENADSPLYVNHIVIVERTASDARSSYAGFNIGAKIGMAGAAEGITQVERNDLWSWGDRSRCVMLHNNGQPYGQIFMGLKGRRYFMLVISGLYFNTSKDIKDFLDPKLKKLDSYEP
jgi:hypothetical protein